MYRKWINPYIKRAGIENKNEIECVGIRNSIIKKLKKIYFLFCLSIPSERKYIYKNIKGIAKDRGVKNQIPVILTLDLMEAKNIMAKSPLMVKWSKECVNLVLDHDLLSGIDKELTQFCKTFTTHDSKEGTAAFLEKRKPKFTGK